MHDEHVWLGGKSAHDLLTGLPTDKDGKDIPYCLDDEQALHALRKLVMDKHLKGIDKVLHQFLVIFNIIIFLNRIHFCNRHTEAVQLF